MSLFKLTFIIYEWVVNDGVINENILPILRSILVIVSCPPVENDSVLSW